MNGMESVLLLDDDQRCLQRSALLGTEDNATVRKQINIETNIFRFDTHLKTRRALHLVFSVVQVNGFCLQHAILSCEGYVASKPPSACFYGLAWHEDEEKRGRLTVFTAETN